MYMSNATVPPAVRKGLYVGVGEREREKERERERERERGRGREGGRERERECVIEGWRKLRGEELHYLLFGE